MITMTQALDKAFPLKTGGRTGLETVMKGVSALAKANQTAGIEWVDFTRQSYADGKATLKKLAAARTPRAALEIQAAYLKDSTERLMSQAQTLRDLYSGLGATLAKPGQGMTEQSNKA